MTDEPNDHWERVYATKNESEVSWCAVGSKIDPAQPQGVGDHRDRRQAHRRRRDHRREQQAGHGVEQSCCDGDAKGVVGEGEEQVLLDVAQGGAGQLARPDYAHQVAAQQGNAGAFHRHIRARAHGDADIGGGKCRCVVHPVAGHRDLVALSAQLVDQLLLRLGQDARAHFVDAKLARHRLCRALVVAGRHDDPQTLV